MVYTALSHDYDHLFVYIYVTIYIILQFWDMWLGYGAKALSDSMLEHY